MENSIVCKEGQFDVVQLKPEPPKNFFINLNAQDVNGITHFYLDISPYMHAV